MLQSNSWGLLLHLYFYMSCTINIFFLLHLYNKRSLNTHQGQLDIIATTTFINSYCHQSILLPVTIFFDWAGSQKIANLREDFTFRVRAIRIISTPSSLYFQVLQFAYLWHSAKTNSLDFQVFISCSDEVNTFFIWSIFALKTVLVNHL